jgi:hypothetical protein
MKKLYPTMVVLCIAVLLHSCATNKSAVNTQQNSTKKMYSANADCFVQLIDGNVNHFSTLKLVTGVFNKPYLLADGKTKIYASEITAYQNNLHYAISQKNMVTNNPSYIAVETLPGFAVRVAKGKLNVYCKKYFNGQNTVNEFYLQQGEDGKIIAYSNDEMMKMVQDCPEAAEFFKQKKSNSLKVLQATASLFNRTSPITKN